jgi:formylglycine-generating enzyme required for sulfatase activity
MAIYHVDWIYVGLEYGRGKQVIPDEMVFVEGGTFTMGCANGQTDDWSALVNTDDCVENQWVSEYPAHSVTVGNFYIGKYPVTTRLWNEVMGPDNMSFYGRDDLRPVVGVWWDDIHDFIAKLNQQTGKNYRLPTEAEWEYAARGGNKSKGYKYSGSDNVDDVAWHSGNSGKIYRWGFRRYYYWDSRRERTVGIKQANELGIHDMSGNVYERVGDWYEKYGADAKMNPFVGQSSSPKRVIRGGSWDDDVGSCRVSSRATASASGSGVKTFGFRLALDPGVGDGQGSNTLTIDVVPKGGGTVTRDFNLETYHTGTNVTLTVEAASGYIFEGWTVVATGKENAVWTEKGNSFRFAMIGDMNVTAVFEKIDIKKELAIDMVTVPGGIFTMGCTKEQFCGNDEESFTLPHSVTVGDFQLSRYEVTQRLWKVVMGNNPSKNTEDDLCPVERVSWNDVQRFIIKLNQQTGMEYRLPTETEWEYAARGGNKSKGYRYSGSNNIDDVAWYNGNSGGKTQKIDTKQPNELGVYNMSGNVYEWVSDWYSDYSLETQVNPTGPLSGEDRVIRGGSWDYGGREACRVSARSAGLPDYSASDVGFRLALSP